MYAVALSTARRYAEMNMTAEVTITRPAEAVLNDVTGYLASERLGGVYKGRARVYSVAGPLLLGIGDESQEFQNTYVSIPVQVVIDGVPYEPDPRPDDLVEVTAHDDPLMVGRTFRCRDTEAAGQFPVVRRMTCMGVEDASHWIDTGAPPVPVEWQ